MTQHPRRRVVTNMTLTLDGRYTGPAGPQDMAWVMPHAVTDMALDHLTSLVEPATTALLGRVNAEGFMGYWPPVADDESADVRSRAYGRWMDDAEKVVLSTTLTEAPWERTRIRNAPAADVVAELRAEDGGDIVVFSSASVIKALLAADEVDRLSLLIVPEVVGGGPRLFDDGLPTATWSLASTSTGESGAVALVYDRAR